MTLRIVRHNADPPPGISYFEAGPEFGGRPHTRVEAVVTRRGPGYDWFIGLRLVVGAVTRMWAHVDDWWNDAEFALAAAPDGAGIVAHVRSSDIESTDDWTRWFRVALAGPMTPIYPGLWQLAEFPRVGGRDPRHGHSPRPPRPMAEIPWPDAFETQVFDDVVPIRRASRADSGRVKWYRKLARQEKLPPVLLMYCAPLLAWVILDGHDRLLAAAMEDLEPAYVALSPVRRREIAVDSAQRAGVEEALAAALHRKPDDQRAVEGVNRALITLYEDHYLELRQRVWPLRGGAQAWQAEVQKLGLANSVIADMLASVPEVR